MIFIIDVSGRVVEYDIGLFDAICKVKKDEDIRLLIADAPQINSNVIRMFRLIPTKFKSSENKVKRIGKAIETLLNYIYVCILCLIKKPSVIHFQWFPFLEFCSVDNYYISLIKFLLPRMRIILTVHNLFPHDMSKEAMVKYENRFRKICTHIDHYIVHVENTKKDLITRYKLQSDLITVIPHGIFKPDYIPKNKTIHRGRHIIMYGNNTPYKGADILLESVQLLPSEVRESVKVTIAGRTTSEFLKRLQSKAEGLDVVFMPTFVPDEQLFKMIDEADYIALPYKEISQSGVLLLALFFRKPLLVSDLPSFVETLEGFTPDMFFKSEDPVSMRDLMMRHFSGRINTDRQMNIISDLNELYSWSNSAQKTIAVYNATI